MASNRKISKQITLRWPDEFIYRIKKTALNQRRTMLDLITEAVCEKLGMERPASMRRRERDASNTIAS